MAGYKIYSGMPGQISLSGSFDTNNTSAPDGIRGTGFTVTRVSAGLYRVRFTNPPEYFAQFDSYSAKIHNAVGYEATVTAEDPEDNAGGGAYIDISVKARTIPVETTGVAVSAHVATLAAAGYVVGVTATTATAAGGKIMQSAASPAAGFVRVVYSAAGVATLTFNATDNVTVASVVVIPWPDAGVVQDTTDKKITFEIRARAFSAGVDGAVT